MRTGGKRRLSIATSRAASGTRKYRTHAQIARRDATAASRGALRARSSRDLVDQCSAYACPMRAHARLLRRTTSTCRSPRNRSSPATSRRAHPAYACVRSIDQAPRKTPEKLASPPSAGTRNRLSGACAPARGARLTSGRGGGGFMTSTHLRASSLTKPMVPALP